MARLALLTVVLVLAAAKDKDKPKKDKPPKLEDFEDDENSYGDEGGPTTLIVGATPEQLGGVGGMYIDDTLADEDQVDFITFEGRGDGILYGNGVPFALKGINWFGSEGRVGNPSHVGPPGGLDAHSADWYFSFLKEQGFNAVR